MGNDKSKSAGLPALAVFSDEEKMKVQKLFDHICGEGTSMQVENFKQHIEKSIPGPFVKPLCELLSLSARKNGIDFLAFASLLSCIFKGHLEERAVIIIQLASVDVQLREVKATELSLFLGYLIDAFYKVTSETQEFQTWHGLVLKSTSKKFAQFLMRPLCYPEWTNKEQPLPTDLSDKSLSVENIEKWLAGTPLILSMIETVFQECFPILETSSYPCEFPKCDPSTTAKSKKKTILKFEDILAISSNFPQDACGDWRQLFGSKTDGQSFVRLVETITKQGPTVLVAEDEDGHVFGAFVSQNWTLSPTFQGNKDCFLFQLNPMVEFFQPTGFNNHYFYLDLNQQTLPNGMGFGGQLDYFGLFLDCDYGIGSCSPSCTTYNCPQLSGSPKFKLESLEVWGVGPIPEKTPPPAHRSIMDKDAEASALLEMTGRNRVSDGFREEEGCQ